MKQGYEKERGGRRDRKRNVKKKTGEKVRQTQGEEDKRKTKGQRQK